MLMTISSTAIAGGRHYGHGFGHSFGHYHGHYHGYHHGYHRHNYGAWAAGAIGLGILGAIVYDQYGRRCYNQIVGYDQFNNPVTRTVCQ